MVCVAKKVETVLNSQSTKNACNLFIVPSQLPQITLFFNHLYSLVENVWLYTKTI